MITNEEIEAYTIKTSSNKILQKYHANKHKSRTIFWSAFSSSIAVTASVVTLIVLWPTLFSDVPSQLNVDKPVFSYQLTSLVNIASSLDSIAPPKALPKLKLQKVENEEEEEDEEEDEKEDVIVTASFQEVVDVYNPLDDVIYNKYYKLEEELNYSYGEYIKDTTNYSLKVTSNKSDFEAYLNYINKNTNENSFTGELTLNNTKYLISGEQKINAANNKSELEMTLKESDTKYIKVEEKLKGNEYSYEYEIKQNKEEIYTYEFEVEDQEVSLEIEEKGISYEFIIVPLSNTRWNVNFEFKENYDGAFSIERTETQKKYLKEDTKEEILINY